MEERKYVYRFGNGTAEGNRNQKELLGGKGANLAEMSTIGLPVPPGFTITTEACGYAIGQELKWPEGLEKQVQEGMNYLEEAMEAEFGDPRRPLLVSVRSGAAVSMPGMMDTVLNLGLNDEVVEGLARLTNNPRFAYDSYRRFIDMYGDVVMGVDHEHFERALAKLKEERDVKDDTELETEDLRELVNRYKAVYRRQTNFMFPDDPTEQLAHAINAVFKSWNSGRAVKYRQISRIAGLKGTAVNVQTMVFGNMGDNSGTGVCFTRNPSDGSPELYGEFLVNAQGEDVVAGIRTPLNIQTLQKVMPKMYDELCSYTDKLERYYQNMQDIEFTVQEGRLYILQTRTGKRTGPAAVKIAVDMVEEGLIGTPEAISQLVEPAHIDQLLHPKLADEEIHPRDVLGKGLPASPGAAVGKVVFDPEQAEKEHANGEAVILVRVETSPEDVGGMSSAEGILTSRGGMTSHAAVVARGWGKPCIAGCEDIVIDYKSQSFTNGETTIHAGDWISLDGTSGRVIRGRKSLVQPKPGESYSKLMEWVSGYQTMNVRTNADTPEDAALARTYGAQGIGLTRTEHMFFKEGRITAMRRMIIAGNEQERRRALDRLLPYQKQDFIGIFEAMEGLPVTIRLLDPPLHEFLPQEEYEIEAVARELETEPARLKAKVNQLKEFNPMLGHRGCRLGIVFPEITEMQARAILEAALELSGDGKMVIPEIMVPLVGTPEEFRHQRSIIDQTARELFKAAGREVSYEVGTMIEIPRACLLADQIARDADFFSFGTNDLTQMTYGYSRDDATKFLPYYLEENILPDDPFQVLDSEGVGQLVEMATRKGRTVKPGLKVGICGEHGGEPASIAFCYNLDLNYVSCSPYRVPVARLAVAQSRIRSMANHKSMSSGQAALTEDAANFTVG
jgi:pyruvate,orthophosphate dikinase